MNKFENPAVEIGGEKFELRCNGAALARLEDIYEGKPFTEALADLNSQLTSRTFKLTWLAQVFCAFAKRGEDQPVATVEWVLENIDTSKDTVKIGEAIVSAVIAHFPHLREGTGDAGGEVDPTSADKA